MKKSYFLSLFFIVLATTWLGATHNRAGEITYTWKGGLTYEAVITTYTKEDAPADRCQLTLQWGDGTSSILLRENGPSGSFCTPPAKMGQSIGNNIKLNIYRGQHTYQAPGFYTMALQDLNRNGGIKNIPNSINVPFFITTILNVNPALGANSSPVLLNPPVDNGCQGRKFIHNPGAFDPDGDSLGYSLIDCRGLNGIFITDTYNPALVQDPVTINASTGDLIWDAPQTQGQFNFAMLITEFRKGANGIWQVVGQITRDLQVDIGACNNQPPVLKPLGPFCVLAGENLQFTVQATDPNGDNLTLTATGGPLEIAPIAQFAQPTLGGNGSVQQVFSWTPACVHVRTQPWQMFFKVEDNPANPAEISLVDFTTVDIYVIAPAPENPEAVAGADAITLNWDASICLNATGYKIYRKAGFYGYVPDSCETGVPAYTGYSFLADVNGPNTTTFVDNNGLIRGMQYCYMVTATFADGAESQASEEVCSELAKTTPIITHVDVLSTSTTTGQIRVTWVAPREIDSALTPPPYSYVLQRADGLNGGNFTDIATLNSLDDTTFLDLNRDTETRSYTYQVVFRASQNNVAVGVSDPASSVYLSILPVNEGNRLTFNYNVPWLNERFTIYRESAPGVFDSIGTSNQPSFADTGLVNGQNYCYKVKAIGRYTGSKLPEPLLNNSQIACATPIDTTAPCVPVVTYSADCAAGTLTLTWNVPQGDLCDNDIAYFNIYFKPTQDSPWPTVPTISNIPATDTTYSYNGPTIVGCYAVTAVDGATPPNESALLNQICIDGCPVIQLPNVFSPNGQGSNNYFRPVRDENGNPLFKDIATFNLEIFNRWGTLVFSTQNPDAFVETGWDGTDQTTGQPVADGVYFYIFTYQPRSIVPQENKVLNGTVTVFR
jgi:gliding motility-associated-like protein